MFQKRGEVPLQGGTITIRRGGIRPLFRLYSATHRLMAVRSPDPTQLNQQELETEIASMTGLIEEIRTALRPFIVGDPEIPTDQIRVVVSAVLALNHTDPEKNAKKSTKKIKKTLEEQYSDLLVGLMTAGMSKREAENTSLPEALYLMKSFRKVRVDRMVDTGYAFSGKGMKERIDAILGVERVNMDEFARRMREQEAISENSKG